MNNPHGISTLQDLVSSLEHKDGVAISWNDKITSKDADGNNIQKNELREITFNELFNIINANSRAFIELGLKREDSVALISGNNPQWIGLSLGVNNAGLINIPLSELSTPKELIDILDHSKPKVVIVEDKKVLDKIDLKNHTYTKHIFSIKDIKGIPNISELRRIGENSGLQLLDISRNDIAGRLYTSGTTGRPKGVQLSHKNLISDFISTQKLLPLLEPGDKGFAYLPPSHVFELGHKYILLYRGMNSFHSSIFTFKEDLKEQGPALFITVPLILKKVMRGILEAMDKKKVIGNIKAIDIYNKLYPYALDYHSHGFNMKSIIDYIPYKAADLLIFSKVREFFGGNLKYLVTGSARFDRDTDDFYIASGLDPLEGLGLTETSPVLTARRPRMYMNHSVGIPIDGVDIRIADPNTDETMTTGLEGEIQAKGDVVMQGYYKDEEETKKVFTADGYFKTGDLGILNEDKHHTLRITGRIKDRTKASNGEYINLSALEETVGKSPYIETVVVVADDNWPRAGALIQMNYEKAKELLHNIGKIFDEANPLKSLYEDMITRKKVPEIEEIISNHLDSTVNNNDEFKSHEKIGGYEFVEDIPMTHTKKIKRMDVKEKFREQIESIYKKITRYKPG